MFETLKKLFIVSFVLWHCLAIGVYAWIPGNDAFNKYVIEAIRPHIRGYILLTSQWQRWNLFAPDPLRRVLAFEIQARVGNRWRRVETIDWRSFGWWRGASELKTIRRLDEDEGSEVLRTRYVQLRCRTLGLVAGTPLKLKKWITVIPRHDFPMPLSWWRSYEPQWEAIPDIETTCPTSVHLSS